jgi:hypothetical protein
MQQLRCFFPNAGAAAFQQQLLATSQHHQFQQLIFQAHHTLQATAARVFS